MKIKVKDPIIKRVVKKFVGRSNVGFKKYGKTLMDDPTDMDGWLNHLQEELMDAVNYIERAREELKRKEEEGTAIFWGRQYSVTPEQVFRTCNCTMGCSTGRCCQDPPIDNGFNGNG